MNVNLIMKSLIMGAGLYATGSSLWSQDVVFKSSSPKASLIELYSSEGCSSCPPAEAWTNDLKTAPGLWKDIFPVAFHVDYWDGLGWPDRFASAVYTQRQRDYANRLGQDSVYTPEFILNGAEWRRGWFSGQEIPLTGAAKSGSLTVTVLDKKVSAVYALYTNASTQPLSLNVALLGFNVVTDVKAGENSGRSLEHDFVVLGFRSFPLTSDGNGNFQSETQALKSSTDDQPGALVAWVSRNDGTILQIAGGWLKPAGDLRQN
jgi:hypothetical protein